MKIEGTEELLFPDGKIRKKHSALVDTVIDAMIEFKNLNKYSIKQSEQTCKHCGNKDYSESGICGGCFEKENGLQAHY